MTTEEQARIAFQTLADEHAGREPFMTMWIVFFNPGDYPGKYVVRANDIFQGNPEPEPRAECAVFDTLGEARAAMPEWGYCIPRAPDDPPQVVETWL